MAICSRSSRCRASGARRWSAVALREPGPVDWYLLGGTATPPGGLRWQAKNGFHIDALVSQSQSALSSLCGIDCDAGRARGIAGSLGLGWMSADGGLDLSYGLSWLQTRDATSGFQGIGAGAGVALLTLPEALSSGLDQQTALLHAAAGVSMKTPQLDIGAAYGKGSTLPYATLGAGALPGIDIDQLSLSSGVDAGCCAARSSVT